MEVGLCAIWWMQSRESTREMEVGPVCLKSHKARNHLYSNCGWEGVNKLYLIRNSPSNKGYVHPGFETLGYLLSPFSPGSQSCSELVDHLASQNHHE